MVLSRVQINRKICIISLLFLLWAVGQLIEGVRTIEAQAQHSAIEGGTIKAYFVGYEGNDLIFHIINEGTAPIKIKGLSYRSFILYRPLKKETRISPATGKTPFDKVLFRTTGDFVWSEKHMHKFHLAYQLEDVSTQLYTQIHPLLIQPTRLKK